MTRTEQVHAVPLRSWNKRDTQFAAKLYSLAVLACTDCGGAENDTERDVMQRSIDQAEKALARMGFSPGEVSSLEKCIQQTLSRRPRKFGAP